MSNSSNGAGLEASGICVAYGKSIAVGGVDLACSAGTITALVGANGAGKSSLFHALIGSTSTTAGTVRLADEDVSGLGANARTQRGIALVPQGRHVFPTLTVRENLSVIADSLRLDHETIGHGLQRFPILMERQSVLAGLLSGGEQQMLAIARALMSKPKVLLLDEPALGLAPAIVSELMRTVEDAAVKGAAVLIAEPSTSTLRIRIDAGLVIQRGSIVHRGDGSELAEAFNLSLGIHATGTQQEGND